jgi:hypothetical protein
MFEFTAENGSTSGFAMKNTAKIKGDQDGDINRRFITISDYRMCANSVAELVGIPLTIQDGGALNHPSKGTNHHLGL